MTTLVSAGYFFAAAARLYRSIYKRSDLYSAPAAYRRSKDKLSSPLKWIKKRPVTLASDTTQLEISRSNHPAGNIPKSSKLSLPDGLGMQRTANPSISVQFRYRPPMLFRLSSAVEQSAVNRSVVGSNPMLSAIKIGPLEKWLNSYPFQGYIHGFESRTGHQLAGVESARKCRFFVYESPSHHDSRFNPFRQTQNENARFHVVYFRRMDVVA